MNLKQSTLSIKASVLLIYKLMTYMAHCLASVCVSATSCRRLESGKTRDKMIIELVRVHKASLFIEHISTIRQFRALYVEHKRR